MAETTVSKTDSATLGFNHPLFLHPSDTQTLTLVSAVLTGSDNYPTWSRAMRIALLGKNKLCFVDGTCTRDMQPSDLRPIWDRCNAVVLSWLINSVDKSIFGGLTFSENAQSVWTDLKERFGISDGTKIFGLHRSINTMSQGSLSVSTYYSKLKDLWEEYDSIVILPSCNCSTSQTYTKIVQEQRLFQFLMGLNETYHQACSHILLLSPLPTVNQAYSMISQQEAQFSFTPTSTNEGVVMMSQGGRGGRGRGRGGVQGRGGAQDECSHCHRKGHKREQCYHLIGFPPNWKPRSLRDQGNRGNSAMNINRGTSALNPSGTTATLTPNLTPQQYEQLLHLLEKDSQVAKKDTIKDSADTTVGAIGAASGHLEWEGEGDW